MEYLAGSFDVAVIGAGHAGVEAALAAARLGASTVLFTISLDGIANMPCNPSIGGTAKGHLVREIDALGGQMGLAADATFLQSRMLNRGKGPAVHSLRVQSDRRKYHAYMKHILETTPNLVVKQGEIVAVRADENGNICQVVTRLEAVYQVKTAILATGTYLKGRIYVGEVSYEGGPDSMQAANLLSQSLRELNQQLDSISAKARVFRAMERDFESYNKAVRMVMQEYQRGSLRNIHGPVSRLIRTQDNYTVAVEIALGAAMQQIVVDSEQDGKAAISYLKRTGGGRATFLPLTGIQGRALQETGLENCRGFVGIASQLVSSDIKYRSIVENLLGRTVIVQDMDAAIAMAQKYRSRFKIVTLDGQVMNPGGSMTGGSVNKDAGILSRANELEKLGSQEKKMQRDKQVLEAELQEAHRQCEQVDFQITAAKDQLREAEDQVLRLEGQQKQYEVLLDAITQAESSAQREKEALEQRDQSDRQRYAAQQAKVQVYTQELAQTQEKLAQLEGSQSETTEETNAVTEKMTAVKTEEAALDAERTTALAHIEDLQSLRTAMEGDREKKIALMDAMREDTARLEKEIHQLKQKQQENDQESVRMQTKMQETLENRAEVEAAKTRAEREAQEKNKDILNMERACALLEQKKVTSSMEERQIIDKLWDSYGLTPGTAGEYRGEIENVAAGNRLAAELKRKIAALGTPNLGAIEEYARINERYTYLAGQRDDVLTSKRELESVIRDITAEMTTIFVSEFSKIDHYFGQTFEEMFGGGKGQLILEDPENPLTCGIEIRVQPPGKQVKTITLLSGGEKAFVATALYFSILKVRPTPFCILDEIDAALDDRNVERFANYLHNLSKKTQFIVITHRRGTMEASDVLYGVTMQEQGVSKLLRLDLNQMEEYLGIVE